MYTWELRDWPKYEDGNGRVGRAIADKALSESLGEPSVISIAAVISRHRKAYYAQLNRASKDSLQLTSSPA